MLKGVETFPKITVKHTLNILIKLINKLEISETKTKVP